MKGYLIRRFWAGMGIGYAGVPLSAYLGWEFIDTAMFCSGVLLVVLVVLDAAEDRGGAA